MRGRLARVCATFGAVLALGAGGKAFAACAELDTRLKAAISASEVAALPGLADELTRDTSCDAAYVAKARRAVALAILAAGRTSDGSAPADVVERAAAIARPWQVAMALGDLRYGQKNYAEAARAYDAAIDEIRDPQLVPKPPAQEIEKYLAQRSYQARSLAPTYVATRSIRGAPGGAMAAKFRNFTAVAVPVPIRFETGEATLTPDGMKAVDELYTYLASQKAMAVVLTGHTDTRGGMDYNDHLSMQRARTVSAELKKRGLPYTIRVEGAGERQPFKADDPAKYTRDELFAFDRRVEYRLVQ